MAALLLGWTALSAEAKSQPKTGHIGSTLTVVNENSQHEAVKLVAVIDPAQLGAQGSAPTAGSRLVGVEIKITNKSKGLDSRDADLNVSVVGSNNQGYEHSLDAISECTNFSNGFYNLSKGQSATGCVTFQLPNGVKVSKVKYNPNGGAVASEAVWKV